MAALLDSLQSTYPHTLERVEIDADSVLRGRYGWLVPVVVIARRWTLVTRIDRALLCHVLARATAEGAAL